MNNEIKMMVYGVLIGFLATVVGLNAFGKLDQAKPSMEPFPCFKCLSNSDHTWFVGDIDPSRPYDGVFINAHVKQKDGSFKHSTHRFSAVDFKAPIAPKEAKPSVAKTPATSGVVK